MIFNILGTNIVPEKNIIYLGSLSFGAHAKYVVGNGPGRNHLVSGVVRSPSLDESMEHNQVPRYAGETPMKDSAAGGKRI